MKLKFAQKGTFKPFFQPHPYNYPPKARKCRRKPKKWQKSQTTTLNTITQTIKYTNLPKI